MQSAGFMVFAAVSAIIISIISFSTHASLNVTLSLLWSIIHAIGMIRISEKWVNLLVPANNVHCMLMVLWLDWISNDVGFYSKDYY
jgi:hypothetical protein